MTATSPGSAAVITEVVPPTFERVDPGTQGARDWMSRRYRSPRETWVRINLVTTVTGSTIDAHGSSASLSSRTDRFILGAIRREADVVVVGAETVRAEGYLLPRTARLAIVTASGRLGEGALRPREGVDAPPALILCPDVNVDVVAAALGDAPAEVVGVPASGERLTPEEILATLTARGLRRVVCEGGAGVATQFVEAGVVDEVCVTVSPMLEPARHPFLALADPVPTTVAGMLVDEAGFSYLRLTPGR
jgi:5-amino-6-(5-phosphoribosylamino)uracil reductase